MQNHGRDVWTLLVLPTPACLAHAYASDRNLLTPVSSLQGVFLVPGLFWFMTSCTDAGGAGSAGSDMATCSDSTWCANGTQCDASPKWLVQKVQLYWEWALTEQGIHGFNTWHWADRPTMMPASFRRGAVSLGSELLQALQEVGRNITKAHPDPRKLPPLFFCVHNQCVPSGNRSGVSEAACELDCGPQTGPQKLSPSVSKSDDDTSWFTGSVRPPRGGRSAGVRGPQPPAASGQIVNVKSFGALGDGITPDDAAIQAAIDSAAATRNDSTPAVYFPSGRYMLQRTLRVSPHGEEGTATRLIGDGPASQLIAGVALRGLSMLQYGLWDSPAPATMSEGEISGLGFNNTMGHAIYCINASYVSYSSFANLVLLSAPTQSSHRVALLQMDNVWGNTLVRNRFDCGGAICLQGTNGIHSVEVSDNRFADFSTAILFAGADVQSANVRIDGNEFFSRQSANASSTPSIVASGVNGLTVSNNFFQSSGGNGSGMCSDILLNGALPGFEGLLAPSITQACGGVVLTANFFYPNQSVCKNYSAITLVAAVGVSVTDNTCWAVKSGQANLPSGFGMPARCVLISTGLDASQFFTQDVSIQSAAAVRRDIIPFGRDLGGPVEVGFADELRFLPYCGAYSAKKDGSYDCWPALPSTGSAVPSPSEAAAGSGANTGVVEAAACQAALRATCNGVDQRAISACTRCTSFNKLKLSAAACTKTDIASWCSGPVLGSAGESKFHTYTSPTAFKHNFAAGSVPGDKWLPLGGAIQVVFNKTGQVDGFGKYTWTSAAESMVQTLDLEKNPSIAGTEVYFAVRVRSLAEGTCLVLGIDPGTGQWLHTVDESNAGNSRCIPLQMDRWEVHSFATTLSTSGTARFTIAAFRYFNDTVPDAGGHVSLVLPVVIAPVGASYPSVAGQHAAASCVGPAPPVPGPTPPPPVPPPPPAPAPPPALFRCVNDVCVQAEAGRPGVSKAACEAGCR